MRNLIIATLLSIVLTSCSKNQENMKSYVIEVTTFKYKSTVDAAKFWTEDSKIKTGYTSRQSGFISRESGYSKNNNEVIVVVRWKTQQDADTSMQKFMSDTSVLDYVNMVDGPTMKMTRYDVK